MVQQTWSNQYGWWNQFRTVRILNLHVHGYEMVGAKSGIFTNIIFDLFFNLQFSFLLFVTLEEFTQNNLKLSSNLNKKNGEDFYALCDHQLIDKFVCSQIV